MAIFQQLAPMKSVPHRVAKKIWETHEDDTFRFDLQIILSFLVAENSLDLNTSVLAREDTSEFKKALKVLKKGGFIKTIKNKVHKTALLEQYYYESQQERDAEMFDWSAIDAMDNHVNGDYI